MFQVLGIYPTNDAFHSKSTGICTQNDGFYTESDVFYTQNDGFYTKNDEIYTQNDGPIPGIGFLVVAVEKGAKNINKCVFIYGNDDFCIKHDDFMLTKC